MRLTRCVAILVVAVVTHTGAAAQSVRAGGGTQGAVCAGLTTQDCGHLVSRLLEDGRQYYNTHPTDALRIAAEWDRSFRRFYLAHRDQPLSEGDLAKIEREVRDRIDPIGLAEDHLLEEGVKRWLPRLAPILAAVASAPVEFLLAYLWPSPAATDLQMLMPVNRRIHGAVAGILDHSLEQDWLTRYHSALRQVSVPRGKTPVVGGGDLGPQVGPDPSQRRDEAGGADASCQARTDQHRIDNPCASEMQAATARGVNGCEVLAMGLRCLRRAMEAKDVCPLLRQQLAVEERQVQQMHQRACR